jgi:signal transduction histidine kinase
MARAIGYPQLVNVLDGPAGTWLGRRSPVRRAAAWILAVAGPALLTLAALVVDSSLVLGGFLFSGLLVVIAAAAIGGARPALTAVVLCVLTRVFVFAPFLTTVGADMRPNPMSVAGFTIVGVGVSVLVGELAELAEDHASSRRVEAALRRVATLAAAAAPADALFAAVTEEVGQLLSADLARLARYDAGDTLTVVAAWSRTGEHLPVRSQWALGTDDIGAVVRRTGRPARIDNVADVSRPLAADAREQGLRSAAGAPIVVEGHIWGVIVAGSNTRQPLPPDTEARLASFTELVATAIANADSRAGITRLAEEQAALRRVATLVARGAAADELFAAVAREAGELLKAGQMTMVRYGSDGTSTVVANWARAGEADPPVGARERLDGNNLSTIIWQTRSPARIDSYSDATGAIAATVRHGGFRSTAGAPIVVQSRTWGALIAGTLDERPLRKDTEARLASFSELVATAISNAESLAELTASRARVVAAADATRRRIERDLHDGAQQRLVSLSLTVHAARAAIPPQLGELDGELAHVAGELASVLEDLQEMARGIHPAILAQGGLGPALKTLARRSSIPVNLHVRASARLPERVEVAAYYVVSEALTNAVKHAHATVVHVDADTAGGTLRLRVRDDGDGGADPAHGTGLVGLRDRVEALGGTITVHSPSGEGTSLNLELPLGAP